MPPSYEMRYSILLVRIYHRPHHHALPKTAIISRRHASRVESRQQIRPQPHLALFELQSYSFQYTYLLYRGRMPTLRTHLASYSRNPIRLKKFPRHWLRAIIYYLGLALGGLGRLWSFNEAVRCLHKIYRGASDEFIKNQQQPSKYPELLSIQFNSLYNFFHLCVFPLGLYSITFTT